MLRPSPLCLSYIIITTSILVAQSSASHAQQNNESSWTDGTQQWGEEQAERGESAVDSAQETIRPYKEGIEYWRQTADEEVESTLEDLREATSDDRDFNYRTVCDIEVFLEWDFSATDIISQAADLIEEPCENIDLTIGHHEDIDLEIPDEEIEDPTDIQDDPTLATFDEYDLSGVTDLFIDELYPGEDIDLFQMRVEDMGEDQMANDIHSTPISEVPQTVEMLEEHTEPTNWLAYAGCGVSRSTLWNADRVVTDWQNGYNEGPFEVDGQYWACQRDLGFVLDEVNARAQMIIDHIEPFHNHYWLETGPPPSTSVY